MKTTFSNSLLKSIKQYSAIPLFSVLALGAAQTNALTDILPVTAEVPALCTLSVVSPVAFGQVDPNSLSPVHATGEIEVNCAFGQAYSLSLDGGLSGDTSARFMQSAVDALSYDLYFYPPETPSRPIWGDGSPGEIVDSFGTGTPTIHTVYGTIEMPQLDAGPGSYQDLVTVTLAVL